jgi:hypothetical protein
MTSSGAAPSEAARLGRRSPPRRPGHGRGPPPCGPSGPPGDEPWVDAAAGGVDPNGVAAVAGHPELMARIVFALVAHPGHGADPRFNAKPPSNATSSCQRAAPPPSVTCRWHLAGDTCCGQRRHRGDYFYVPVRRGVCLLQVQGTSSGPALPTWGRGRPGMTGLLGTGPRAMPLRAAPGRSSGPQRVPAQPSATRNRCSRHLLPALRAPVSSATHEPRTNLRSRQPCHHRGGPSSSSEADSTAAVGAHGDAMTGGEDEPEPDGS